MHLNIVIENIVYVYIVCRRQTLKRGGGSSVMILGRLPGCAFYESLTCLLHMRMMFACRLVTVPSWPPSFSVRSSQSRSYNRYRIFGTRSSNNIPGLVPKVGHCASFENRFIPVPSFEVSS